MSSIAPYLYAVPLFVPEARSFVPACAAAGAPRARGRQGLVRPCVARGFRRSGGRAVLHQCIRLLIGACCAPSHHGYQRAFGLITGPASNGPFGSPGFACAGKTDPPSRLILSQTSAGNRL